MTSRAAKISVAARAIEDDTVVRAASASYTRTGNSDEVRTLHGPTTEKEQIDVVLLPRLAERL
jgi:hypothetical protein